MNDIAHRIGTVNPRAEDGESMEPTPRPLNPAWQRKCAGTWTMDDAGLVCFLFRSCGGSVEYYGAVQLPSGPFFSGAIFKGIEQAAKDVRALSRLARIYQLEAAGVRPATGCHVKATWPRRSAEVPQVASPPAAAPGAVAATVRSRAELESELEGVRCRIKAAHEVDDEVDRRLRPPENLDEAQRRRYSAKYGPTADALVELTVAESVLEWVLGQRRRSPSDVVIPDREGA